jgi:peptidyl-prolyl cis-trans isomerase SurA
MNRHLKAFKLWTATAARLAWLVAISAASTLVSAQGVDVDRVIAVVNNEVITLAELNARVDVVTRQMRRQRVEPPPMDVLRSQILERIVLDRAQLQAAREQGIRIDDAMLDRAIGGIAQQNRLSVEQLRAQIERDGRPFSAFREDIRVELTLGRLREREVDMRVQVSEADIDSLLAESGSGPVASEYNIGVILLRLPESAGEEEVRRQRLRAEELQRQVERGVDFARLASSFSEGPEAAEGGALGWRNADRLPNLFVNAVSRLQPGQTTIVRSPAGFHLLRLQDRRDPDSARLTAGAVKQTKARHILIRVNEITSDTEAQRRLRDIRSRILAKTTDFPAMARQFSADGSASNGGDLGWVYAGDTVPEFERAMDALAPGQLSEPIRSPFGWHLIEVLERRTDEASPERMRQLARMTIRERRADEVYQEWLRELRDRTFVELRLD